MMNENWLWLDMDGSIVDFYGVDGWLEDLRNFNPRPYIEAKPLYNMNTLCAILAKLKEHGYHIGIISWLSKVPEPEFDIAVTEAKVEWLDRYGLGGICDEILVTPHGVPKHETCAQYGHGILVDDEAKNRNDWNIGATIDANKNILAVLLNLLA